MKKILAPALLLLAATTGANASDWLYIGEDQNTEVHVDADKIQYANKSLNQRTAWVKVKYKRPDPLYKVGEYTLANQIIDCNRDKFSVSRVIAYYANGQMKAQTPMSPGWMDIPPDSNFDYVAATVCTYPHI